METERVCVRVHIVLVSVWVCYEVSRNHLVYSHLSTHLSLYSHLWICSSVWLTFIQSGPRVWALLFLKQKCVFCLKANNTVVLSVCGLYALLIHKLHTSDCLIGFIEIHSKFECRNYFISPWITVMNMTEKLEYPNGKCNVHISNDSIIHIENQRCAAIAIRSLAQRIREGVYIYVCVCVCVCVCEIIRPDCFLWKQMEKHESFFSCAWSGY